MDYNKPKVGSTSISGLIGRTIILDTTTNPNFSIYYFNDNTSSSYNNSQLINELSTKMDLLIRLNIGKNALRLNDFCFKDCKLLTSVTIGSNVTYLGNDCFNGCTNLKEVIIESDSLTFGSDCFFGCINLTKINIPPRTTEISKGCFDGCINLNEMILNPYITKLNDFCFANCYKLTTLTIPASITAIGNGCFYETINLDNFYFEDLNNLIECGDFIFGPSHTYSYITIVNLKDSSEITSNAFRKFAIQNTSESLDSVIYIYLVQKDMQFTQNDLSNFDALDVRSSLEYGTVITYTDETIIYIYDEVIIQESITRPENIISVTIGKDVLSLNDNCFINCELLSDIFIETTFNNIPINLTSIGKSCFESNIALTNITLPINLKSIDEYAFSNCILLEDIYIPNGVTFLGSNLFSECSLLQNVRFQQNSLLDTLKLNLFYKCYNLINIIIPNSVTKIENSAFYKCRSLLNLNIPNSITSFGNNCFEECSSLNLNINLSDSKINSFGSNCFKKCTALTAINIPKTTTNIGSLCFANCNNLTSIVFDNANNLLSCGNSIFLNNSVGVTIYLKGIARPSEITSNAFKSFASQTFNYTSLASPYFVYDSSDSGSGSNTDSGSGSNTDSGTGSNTDSGSGSNTDSGTGSNTDSGTGSNTDSGTGSNTDSGTDSLPGQAINNNIDMIFTLENTNLINNENDPKKIKYTSGKLIKIPINVPENLSAFTMDNDGNIYYSLSDTFTYDTYLTASSTTKITSTIDQIWKISNNDLQQSASIFIPYTGLINTYSIKPFAYLKDTSVNSMFFTAPTSDGNQHLYVEITRNFYNPYKSNSGTYIAQTYNTDPLNPDKDDYNYFGLSRSNIFLNKNTVTDMINKFPITIEQTLNVNRNNTLLFYATSKVFQNNSIAFWINKTDINVYMFMSNIPNYIESNLKQIFNNIHVYPTLKTKIVYSSLYFDIAYFTSDDNNKKIVKLNLPTSDSLFFQKETEILLTKTIDQMIIDIYENIYCIHYEDQSITKIVMENGTAKQIDTTTQTETILKNEPAIYYNYYNFPREDIFGLYTNRLDNTQNYLDFTSKEALDSWFVDLNQNIYRFTKFNSKTLYKIVPNEYEKII